MFNQMKQLREKFKDMEKKFAEASLQAKSSETSSPSNPSQQYNYTSKRGRCRFFKKAEDHKIGAEVEVFIMIEIVVDQRWFSA